MVVAVHFVASPTVFAVLVGALRFTRLLVLIEAFFLPPLHRDVNTVAVNYHNLPIVASGMLRKKIGDNDV